MGVDVDDKLCVSQPHLLLLQRNTAPTSTPSTGWSLPIDSTRQVSRRWLRDPLRAAACGSTKVTLTLRRLRLIVGPVVLPIVLNFFLFLEMLGLYSIHGPSDSYQ